MKTEFSDTQYESAYPDGIEEHWWFYTRSKIIANTINSLAGSRSSVLEVGCGRGVVVTALRAAGIDCRGVELADVTPVDGAEEHIQFGIEAVDLSSSERQRYDTLLLLDVIEHIPEPGVFMQTLADAFPRLKHVIVTVPASNELWSNYDEFYGHHRRYTPAMLQAVSDGLGWELVWKSYFFHLVYLPAWILSRFKKDRDVRLVSPRGAGRLIHKFISFVMLGDYYLIPGNVPGTSIIACFSIGKTDPQGSGR